ncbi:hypothetical protein RS84_00823 [Microbacterium hydrocarbonoxydans]|uniref:Uncharacterized protein n=1 Tax=Microbacterium hydrocarbonoxydans TaxID=273678 RepID=A0A0M2HPM5_9MICO|nr:hypothetical protein [Microbacterium hydrocarbonoxydans]KJL48656.1 hypothetical protein RS84_00823 [Microbacterium hydrocarbonoxydans]
MNETPENPRPDQPEPTPPPAYQPEPVQPPAPYQPEPVQPPAPYQAEPPVFDPNAQPAAPADPYAAPADPNAYPGAAPAYPGAGAPADPNAYPGAAPAYPGAGAPADPNAYPGAAPAYPGAAAPGSAGPGDPNAPYPGAYPAAGFTPAPKKPMPKGLLIGLIAGGAVVVLAIAAAVIVPIVTRPPKLSASDYVEEYLTALADGDAEKALTYVENYGGDDLLTADVLKESLKLGKIDKIKVGEVSEGDYGDTEVPVTFTIGDTKVDRTFDVSANYDGTELTIIDGLVSFSGLYGFEGLGLTVNGAEASTESQYVFPGTYQLAVGPEEFAIEGESTVVVANDEDTEALYEVKPILSEAGTASFRELVKASFAECLAMKTLDTPCGMNTSTMSQDGYTPVDGTVTRTIDAENQSTLDNLEPYVSERAIVTTYDYWSVDITLQASNGSSTEPFEVLFGGEILTPKVDFSAETPAVIWE